MKNTSLFKKIYRFDQLDSTNAGAIRRAKAGEPEGAVFVADFQTAGRGRMGRGWESPPGKNLYVSFLLRPNVTPEKAVGMTQVAAIAVKATLEDLSPCPTGLTRQTCLTGGEVKIKPPNDIILNGKKVAGILCEMGSQGERTEWVVCGIGINVNADLGDFSEEVQKTATSLKIEFRRKFEREEVLKRLIEVFGRHYESFMHRSWQ